MAKRRSGSPGRLTASWQRWTIDEIDAGLARVALAESQYPLESNVAEAYDSGEDLDALREAVFRVENSPPEDIWGDEEAAYLAVDALDSFLRRRADIKALPDPRPLREGDVFWIVLPVEREDEARLGLSAADILDRAEQLGPQVWDVTAAARQAAKRTYDDAVRAATDEAPPLEPVGA
jgi:hypothetical protein